MKKIYKATEDGCVIEVSDGCVVYESIEDVPAKEIAKAMNWLASKGVPEEWDWKNVRQRLIEKGVILRSQRGSITERLIESAVK